MPSRSWRNPSHATSPPSTGRADTEKRHKSGRANTGWGVGPRGRVSTPQMRTTPQPRIESWSNTGENCQPRLLAVFLAFAAELLELGENGADIELSRLLLRLRGGRDFRFLARGCLGGRQQSGASIGR